MLGPEQSAGAPTRPANVTEWPLARAYYSRHSQLLLAAAVFALVLLRAWPHVFSPDGHFDSDQAIMGIMGNDLAHARALPLFCYGQKYLFAIEAWLAAPMFILFGASVATLKLPLLALNYVTAWLLLRYLVVSGLPRTLALVALLPFLVPSIYIAKVLVAAHGANIEPFVAVPLLWALRKRPIGFGLVAGLFYLNREFVVYAIVALVIVEALNPSVRNRRWLFERAVSVLLTFATVLAGRALGRFGANYYGSDGFPLSLEDEIGAAATNVVTKLLPVVLGIVPGPHPLSPLSVDLSVFTTMQAVFIALALVITVRALVLIASPQTRDRFTWESMSFPLYLVLVALAACTAMILFEGQPKDIWSTRYILLALLGPIGALALYLRAEPWRPAGLAVVSVVVLLFAGNALQHGAMLWQSVHGLPKSENRALAEALIDQGVEIGIAPYWQAYAISFLTDERVRLDATETVRVRRYEDEYRARLSEATDLQQERCKGGVKLGGWYACPHGTPRKLALRH